MNILPNYSSIVLTLWEASYKLDEKNDKYKLHNINDSSVFRCFGEFGSMAISPAGKASLSDSLIEMRKIKQQFMNISIDNGHDVSIESVHSIFAIQHKDTRNDDFFSDFNDACTKPLLFAYLINFSHIKGEGHIYSSSKINAPFNIDEYNDQGVVLRNVKKLKDDLQKPVDLGNDQQPFFYSNDFTYYLSLSSCDLVVFYKTKSYKMGILFVDALRKITGAQYSYSICGIYDMAGFASTCERNKKIEHIVDSCDDEVIDNLTIAHGIGEPFYCNKWDDDCKNWLTKMDPTGMREMFTRLGTDDRVISIPKVKFRDIVDDLIRNDGLFSNESENYRRGLLRAKLYLDTGAGKGPFPVNQLSERDNAGYYKRAYDIIFKYYDPKTEEAIHLLRALRTALFSCDHLAKTGFALDLLDYIEHTFDMFLDKLEKALKANNNNYSKDIIKDINDYLSAMLSIVNNSMQWERTLFQNPGFITNLYEIPSKILHFVSAFTRLTTLTIKKLDATCYTTCDYRFILRPMLSDKMTVYSLFSYEINQFGRYLSNDQYLENPLARVKIPMYMFFEPQNMLLEITHEVAHKVGIHIRQRNKRYQNEFHMILTSCIERLFYVNIDPNAKKAFSNILKNEDLNGLVKVIAKSFFVWKKGKEKQLYENIIKSNLNNTNELFNNNDVRFSSEYTLSCQQELLKEYFLLILPFTRIDKEQTDAQSSIINIYTKEKREEINDDPDSTDSKLINFLEYKLYFDNFTAEAAFFLYNDIDSIVENVRTLSRESYADMLMIVSLGLTAEEYLRYIYLKSIRLNMKEKMLYEGMCGEKVLSVLKTFKGGSDGINNNYEIANKENDTLWETSVGKLYKDTIDNPENWINIELKSHPCDATFLKNLKIFETYNKAMSDEKNMWALKLPIECIRKNIEYLRNCRNSWPDKIVVKDHFKELRTIYRILSEEKFDEASGMHNYNPLSFLALSDWFSNNLK